MSHPVNTVEPVAVVVDELNPAQQEVIDALGAPREERPVFDAGLRDELAAELEDGLAPVVAAMPAGTAGRSGAGAHMAVGGRGAVDHAGPLTITKHLLSAVHGCEVRFLEEDATGFRWSVPLARGSVAHKAIELSVNLLGRGAWTPSALVDEALARLADDDRSLGDWLRDLDDVSRAELRNEANDCVAKFLECWPPLSPSWRPVLESRLRADLACGRIQLVGKVDLTLGRPVGTTAGKVLVDLKTGGFSPAHVDDLRFYALVETLRLGVPPRRLATYYLDAGRMRGEDVTVESLFSAVARVVDGVGHIVALRLGSVTAVRRVGPPCRWCPLLSSCSDGQAHLAEAEDR
jgi:hypothetical protein